MKKVILSVVVVFSTLFFVGCSSKDSKTVTSNESSIVAPDTVLTDYQKAKQTEAKNLAVSKSQEIPTGTETFEKIVAYIWKHGFTITGGSKNIPCGKQYTFFDSRGNRHAYLAIKTDPVTNEASMTGKVQSIFTYGYKQGIRDQEHLFPYNITAVSVSCPILELNGTWKCVEESTFWYKEFLTKVNKQ